MRVKVLSKIKQNEVILSIISIIIDDQRIKNEGL
jgi:hypothetical protein